MSEKLESQLVAEIQKGNQNSFNILIAQNLTKIKGIIHRNFPDLRHEDFSDIFQKALIRAWNKIENFRGDCMFLTWFLVILRNETISFMRAKNAIKSHELSLEDMKPKEEDLGNLDFFPDPLDDLMWQDAENILEKKEQREIYGKMLNETIGKLDKNYAEVINLALKEQKSYKEIASLLNLPIGTIMSRVFYARKALQKIILAYANRNGVELPVNV